MYPPGRTSCNVQDWMYKEHELGYSDQENSREEMGTPKTPYFTNTSSLNLGMWDWSQVYELGT